MKDTEMRKGQARNEKRTRRNEKRTSKEMKNQIHHTSKVKSEKLKTVNSCIERKEEDVQSVKREIERGKEKLRED
ncbi:hypothetical protein AVEN_248866-1 [Araneus ventricosus]|uniref:Uncharacterized protein n=1 Tax=Araneus ventricosus TaxID=182803 RepID=A0A4Y2SE84_ARAVE|nr:hypothetical protein AVEN_248866-1 [Araneus ventricosus]